MTDPPRADGLHRDDAATSDEDEACPYCAAARDPVHVATGQCPAIGTWDPDAARNRQKSLAFIEQMRRVAEEADDATDAQEVEKDDARR